MERIFNSSRTPVTEEQLREAYRAASEAGWHAGEGEPVLEETFDEASRFLAALPGGLRPTDAYAEPDGDLALEWSASRGQVMIVSFDGRERVIYRVRLSDQEKAAGETPFVDRVPEVLLFHLNRVG